jgi:hypothetical protein
MWLEKIHEEELHHLYSSLDIITVINPLKPGGNDISNLL